MTVSQSNLYAIVQRGQNLGIRVTPHKYADAQIESYIRRGYGVRDRE